MRIVKKIWEILCIFGIVWGILTAVVIYYIQYSIYSIESRGQFKPDMKTIMLLSVFVMGYVFLNNTLHFGSREEIGLFTFLKNPDNQPNSVSEKRKKAQNPQIPRELLSDKPEGIILGKFKNKYVRFLIKTGVIMHILILGSVGTGKSTLLIASLISYLYSDFMLTKNKKRKYIKPNVAMFVLDIKPELYNAVSNMKCPYVRAINPEDRDSWGWNVYYALNKNSTEDQIVEQLDIISLALISEQKGSKNGSFFADTARNVFVGIMLYAYKKGMSFMESLDYLMDDSLDDVLNEIIEKIDGKPNYKRVRSLLKPYIGKGNNEALQNVEMTIRQGLKPFLSEKVRWLLNDNPKKCSPLDLEKRISLFLCLKDSQMASYDVLMRLIIMQLVKHGTNRKPDSHALIYVIDEAPRLGGTVLKEITNFMALSRGFNVACVLLAQSINQFYKEMSPEETETLMEICRIIGVLSCKSKKQADLLAGWAGTYLEKKTSYSHKSQKDINNFNVSYDEKPILNASDMMHLMDKKEILLFVDGDFYKANAEQARYYKIPEFNRIAERNKRINSRK